MYQFEGQVLCLFFGFLQNSAYQFQFRVIIFHDFAAPSLQNNVFEPQNGQSGRPVLANGNHSLTRKVLGCIFFAFLFIDLLYIYIYMYLYFFSQPNFSVPYIAAYLYDAVFQFAIALTKTFEKNEPPTGRNIIGKMVNSSYDSK